MIFFPKNLTKVFHFIDIFLGPISNFKLKWHTQTDLAQ